MTMAYVGHVVQCGLGNWVDQNRCFLALSMYCSMQNLMSYLI